MFPSACGFRMAFSVVVAGVWHLLEQQQDDSSLEASGFMAFDGQEPGSA